MKICPDCALANEERFPACVVCHTSLADVPSTPSPDPAHPEHARRALQRQRRRITRRQLAWAVACYVLFIYAISVAPWKVPDPEAHGMYVASALVIAWVVAADLVGGFLAAALQGGTGVALALAFGPRGLFVAFVLAGQVLAPMLLAHWEEMIHDANR